MYINEQFRIGDIVTFKNPKSDYFKKLLWDSFDYSIDPAYCIETFLKGNFKIVSIFAPNGPNNLAYALEPCSYTDISIKNTSYKFSQYFAFFENDLKRFEKDRRNIMNSWIDYLNKEGNK